MAALLWKATTVLSLGAAVGLAVHPIRTPPSTTEAPRSSEAPHAGAGGGFFGWFGGGTAQAATVDGPEKLFAQLRAAKTATATCDALRALASAQSEEATSAIADHAQAPTRIDVRQCAIEALGTVRLAAARSWLGDLLGDSDRDVRGYAMSALATRVGDTEARGMVITVAKTGEPATRRAALLALAAAHAPEVTPLLLAELTTPGVEGEDELITALGDAGDPAAVDALSKIARDGTRGTRAEALNALGKLGGEKAIGVLRDTLLGGYGDDAKGAALALSQLNDDPAAKSVLLSAVESDRHDVSTAALDALAEMDGDDVRDFMMKELTSTNHEGASAAARYFTTHRDPAVVAALEDSARRGASEGVDAVTALGAIGGDASRLALVDLATHGSGLVSATALQNLARMSGGQEEARKVSISLLRQGGMATSAAVSVLSDDSSSDARDALIDVARSGQGSAAQAISALARHSDDASVRALTEIATGKDERMSRVAIAALGSTGSPAALTALTEAVKSNDPSTQRTALRSLGQIGGPGSEKILIDASASGDSGTRAAAANALGQNPSPGAVSQLEKLARDPDRNVANAAMYGLVGRAPERVVAITEEQMKSDDVNVRRAAAQMGSVLGNDNGRRLFMEGLRDSDPEVLQACARGLANVGDNASQSALADLLMREDAPREARRAAADALTTIGGDTARRLQTTIDALRSPDDGADAVAVDED